MSNRYISLTNTSKAAAAYVDKLHGDRQIDIDENGEPHVLGMQAVPDSPNLIRVFIKRNNKRENFIIKKRGRLGEPERKSFDLEDGFTRDDARKPVKKENKKGDKTKGERSLRISDTEDYEQLIRQLMKQDS